MNFSPIWVNWIMESVTTVTYTLLINGSPSQSFKPEKGLRQGDPLSPYLFLFCASVLSIELMKAERNKEIKGVKLGRQGQTFTHLLFADDSLLFFQKDKYIVPNIQKIVSWNCNLSGQCINLSKSDLFCSPNMAEVEKVALVQSLQINLVQQPSKYLGMKFKLRRNRVADFQVLLDKLQAKLQGWKARLLSQAGRTTLISSILQDMPLYTFCSFKVPETITNKMDCIARFWWGNEPGARKLHLLNWDTICCPRKAGGLGIKKFGTMNKAMLAKQYWRMVHNPNSLLAKTFKPKYFPRTSILDCNPKPHHSWIWKNNISQKNSPLGDSRWLVGKGYEIPINHPAWSPIADPNSFGSSFSVGHVSDLIDSNTNTWKADLLRKLYPHHTAMEILQLPLPKTDAGMDKLVWKHSTTGEYKVKKAYDMLSGTPHRSAVPKAVWSTIWKLKLPMKIFTFIWKLLHNGLQVKSILNIRGIASEPTCPLCSEDDETLSHLFLFCQFSRAVWHGKNLSIHTLDLNQTNAIQWLSGCILRTDLEPQEKDFYLQTICTTLWTLWTQKE